MLFNIPVSSRLKLTIAAAHGAVDAARPPEQLLLYTLALVPLDKNVTTATFGVASVVHFARDLGLAPSLLFHLVVLGVASKSYARAARLVLNYMIFVHVPLLFTSLLLTKQIAAIGFAVATFVLFVLTDTPRITNGCFVFNHAHQMLVIAHTLLSFV